jgi:hypothetical protein
MANDPTRILMRQLGVDATSAMTYKPNSAAAANAVNATSAAVRRSRVSGQSVSYTLGERKASLFENDNDEGAESGRAGF